MIRTIIRVLYQTIRIVLGTLLWLFTFGWRLNTLPRRLFNGR